MSEDSEIPITEWVLDKMITYPAENLVDPAAIAYFAVAAIPIGAATVAAYHVDELVSQVEGVALVVGPLIEGISDVFADDDVLLFPDASSSSDQSDPSEAFSSTEGGPVQEEAICLPADDEPPLEQVCYGPSNDEPPLSDLQPVDSMGEGGVSQEGSDEPGSEEDHASSME